jgi:mannose-1-phosphate guanylyltransferase
MNAIILIGGLGTRMHPLTLTTPKAMLPVLNRPFLEHILQYLLDAGISRVVLATCYLPTAIQDYFGDGRRYRLRISYIVEDPPLGTGGAVKNAATQLDGTFVVLNGDIYTDLDLKAMLAFHRESKAVATMALATVEDPSAFGVVVTDDERRITRFVEKPPRDQAPSHHINAGIYILEPHVLDDLPATGTPSMLEKDLFPMMSQRHHDFYGFPFEGFWLDTGTPQNYLKLHQHLLLSSRRGRIRSPDGIHKDSLISGPVDMAEGTVVEPGARLMGPAALGSGCHIDEGAVVDGSVLWDKVWVKSGAVVRDSVLASNCVVAEGCLVEGQVLGEGEEVKKALSTTPRDKKRR